MQVEIEVINESANADLYFLPLGRRLRGHLDWLKVNEPTALINHRDNPEGVPGQRLVIDTEAGKAVIVEPLHEPKNAKTRDRIAAKGYGIPPAREEVANIDVPTCLYWLKRAVDSGAARLVRGTLPARVEGKPRKRFMYAEETDPAAADRALRRQEMAARLALMTPAQRKEYDRLLAGGEE